MIRRTIFNFAKNKPWTFGTLATICGIATCAITAHYQDLPGRISYESAKVEEAIKEKSIPYMLAEQLKELRWKIGYTKEALDEFGIPIDSTKIFPRKNLENIVIIPTIHDDSKSKDSTVTQNSPDSTSINQGQNITLNIENREVPVLVKKNAEEKKEEISPIRKEYMIRDAHFRLYENPDSESSFAAMLWCNKNKAEIIKQRGYLPKFADNIFYDEFVGEVIKFIGKWYDDLNNQSEITPKIKEDYYNSFKVLYEMDSVIKVLSTKEKSNIEAKIMKDSYEQKKHNAELMFSLSRLSLLGTGALYLAYFFLIPCNPQRKKVYNFIENMLDKIDDKKQRKKQAKLTGGAQKEKYVATSVQQKVVAPTTYQQKPKTPAVAYAKPQITQRTAYQQAPTVETRKMSEEERFFATIAEQEKISLTIIRKKS